MPQRGARAARGPNSAARFDPAEWLTAAEQSDHGNERSLARTPQAATPRPRLV